VPSLSAAQPEWKGALKVLQGSDTSKHKLNSIQAVLSISCALNMEHGSRQHESIHAIYQPEGKSNHH
jgi:hypothetical protein